MFYLTNIRVNKIYFKKFILKQNGGYRAYLRNHFFEEGLDDSGHSCFLKQNKKLDLIQDMSYDLTVSRL